MRERRDCTPDRSGAPAVKGEWVGIFVPDAHPLLRLKEAVDWEGITAVMVKKWREANKNVDGGRGLAWPVHLYVPLLVLMWLKSYHSRQMEDYLIESVVARRFLGLKVEQLKQIRDHSSIARAQAALGAGGKAAVNALIIKTAQAWGFSGKEMLSSDTTVQEPAIGYPNEPGILKGWAERIERALRKLKVGGVKVGEVGIEKAKEIYKSVKHYHLFAATKEEKKKLVDEIVKKSEELAKSVAAVLTQVSDRCGRVKHKAKAKLSQMGEVARTLIAQIKQWRHTGKVATEKILHAGIPKARAIIKGKGKGKVKFGMKWLINRLSGGYLFGHRVEPRADENTMPEEGLKDYRELFGQQATPKMVV